MHNIEKVGKKCYGCSSCANICPKKCIEMKAGKDGFCYPSVKNEHCIECGTCIRACPALNTDLRTDNTCTSAKAVISEDKKVLQESSSGGLFSELAAHVLAGGGVVFGAAFADDYKSIQHVIAQDEKDLSLLRGSKYMQSRIGNCYTAVKEQLGNGKKVLFSGTPCQIAGLKAYLGKEYEFLLLVDVICHGVPSDLMWKKYLEDIEQKNQGKTIYANMRMKSIDEGSLRRCSEEQGRLIYYKSMNEDPYTKLFLKNVCLRESCYTCAFKGEGYASDITIGDFWGIESVLPEFINKNGVSLALIHTEKGKRVFDAIRNDIKCEQVDFTSAIAGNPSYSYPAKRPPERDHFYDDLQNMSWDDLVRKYDCPQQKTLKTRVKSYLSSSLLGKLRRRLLGRIVSQNGPVNPFRYGTYIEMMPAGKDPFSRKGK